MNMIVTEISLEEAVELSQRSEIVSSSAIGGVQFSAHKNQVTGDFVIAYAPEGVALITGP
jgi:hypothetical protein